MLGFTDKPIGDEYFADDHGDGNGGMISVADWTERTFGVQLKYKQLPGVKTRSDAAVAAGKKQVIIPLELLVLESAQVVQKEERIKEDLTSEEIKITTGGVDGANKRGQSIMRLGESAKREINQEGSTMGALHMNVSADAGALTPVPGGNNRLQKPTVRPLRSFNPHKCPLYLNIPLPPDVFLS